MNDHRKKTNIIKGVTFFLLMISSYHRLFNSLNIFYLSVRLPGLSPVARETLASLVLVGIEPGLRAWEAPVIPLDHSRMSCGIMVEFKKIMKESVRKACFFQDFFC